MAAVFLFISLSLPLFFPFLKGLLCYISPFHWFWPSICWSCRLLLKCLSHPSPSSTCCELQQIRWYCSWVISSLMWPDCQLQAFNAKVTPSFCLGRLGGLSLRVCRFLLSWPWFAEDRIVLDNVSQQLGPSLFILEHFFFLGVGLGVDMRWTGVAKSFGPIGIYSHIFSKRGYS